MRLLPGSLYGRMVLVLAASLLLSQGASLLVNFFDRGSSIYRLNAEQMVNRIARHRQPHQPACRRTPVRPWWPNWAPRATSASSFVNQP